MAVKTVAGLGPVRLDAPLLGGELLVWDAVNSRWTSGVLGVQAGVLIPRLDVPDAYFGMQVSLMTGSFEISAAGAQLLLGWLSSQDVGFLPLAIGLRVIDGFITSGTWKAGGDGANERYFNNLALPAIAAGETHWVTTFDNVDRQTVYIDANILSVTGSGHCRFIFLGFVNHVQV